MRGERLSAPADGELLRPLLEAAVRVARAGQAAVPPVPPPRALLPFVNFSRWSDKSLANVRRALDEDRGFRERVQSSVTAGDVGAAGWLFLTRPDGWHEELDSLVQAAGKLRVEEAEEREERSLGRRLGQAEEARAEAQRAAAALGEKLNRVNRQLTEERRARRAVETDAGRLRARVAELERDLSAVRDASTQRGSGVAAVEGRAAALDEARAALSAERRRVAALEERCRELEVQRAAAAPPPPPVEEVDLVEPADALRALAGAVGVLAEAVALAASQLAPFLPTPPSGAQRPSPAEPARPVAGTSPGSPALGRRPAPLPPGVPDDSPEAAEHLVRLRDVVVLVDGYNVTKLGRPDLPLAEQRRWLTDTAAGLAARSGAGIEVVFDGADDDGGTPVEPPHRTKVRVRWSPAGVEADDVLLALVEDMPVGRPVVVVSNDRRVRSGAGRRGANVIGSDLFLGLLGQRPA